MSFELDLSACSWNLSGWVPYLWKTRGTTESGKAPEADIPPVPAWIPGSVQGALREAGVLPDWNYAFRARECEWVENRHWIYSAEIELPEEGAGYELLLTRPDSAGWVLLDGDEFGTFRGGHRTHRLPLPAVGAGKHLLAIVLDLPPRWLGQIGRTGEMGIARSRFNYTWDWMPRLVQLGIAGGVLLRSIGAVRLELAGCDTSADAMFLRLAGENPAPDLPVTLALFDGEREVFRRERPFAEFSAGARFRVGGVELWQPNGRGGAKLYEARLTAPGAVELRFRVGFRSVERVCNPGAPAGAAPWLYRINGSPLFLQGINWTPLRPNYADVDETRLRRLVSRYRAMGVNLFRVWGGASRECDLFYDLCDEAGILVWQEFPLSSSGLENVPPDRPEDLEEAQCIAEEYIAALSRHPSLVIWCGGNELFHTPHRLCDDGEPILALLGKCVRELDPRRVWLPASASGPSLWGEAENFGRGMHHDVHGPWQAVGSLAESWYSYWDRDDALFRSEVGAPGASSPELIRKYAGGEPVFPPERSRLWDFPMNWWREDHIFRREHCGRAPVSLEEYAHWSRRRQADALSCAVRRCKERFPACGGVIIWMGHDSFPCMANTSIIDFDLNDKPAALAIEEIFNEQEVCVQNQYERIPETLPFANPITTGAEK